MCNCKSKKKKNKCCIKLQVCCEKKCNTNCYSTSSKHENANICNSKTTKYPYSDFKIYYCKACNKYKIRNS